MKVKSIYDKDFGEGCVGFATHDDLPRLKELSRGTVYVPNTGTLKYIPLARQTRLELRLVEDPEQSFLDYANSLPNPNKERLDYINKQRESFKYKNLGIHPLACIGEDGMGYEWDGEWVEFPQQGGVVLGEDVRVGAFTSIKKGTIHNTIIGDGTKIGSHCNIGHNVKIGKSNLITHGVSIAGSCETGDNCIFWQRSMVAHKVVIGDNCIIGMGAQVFKDVPPNTKVKGVWA